jgi:hypothetical protein
MTLLSPFPNLLGLLIKQITLTDNVITVEAGAETCTGYLGYLFQKMRINDGSNCSISLLFQY